MFHVLKFLKIQSFTVYETLANCKCFNVSVFLRSWPTGIAKTPPPLPWHWDLIRSSTFVLLLFFNSCLFSFCPNPAWRMVPNVSLESLEFLHITTCTWTWWIALGRWIRVPHLNGWPPLRCPSFTMPTKSWQSLWVSKSSTTEGFLLKKLLSK